MKKLVLLVLLIIITSCDEGDIVSTETIADEITRGAVLISSAILESEIKLKDLLQCTLSLKLSLLHSL